MKHILFVIDSLNGGGAEKILLDLLRHLDRNSYEIDLMTIWNRGHYLDYLPDGISYYSLVKNPTNIGLTKYINRIFEIGFKLLSSKILHKLFIRKKYDVEVAFLEGASTKIVAGATCTKYAWVHTDMENNTWYEQFYKNFDEIKKAYRTFNKICHVSNSLLQAFERKFKITDTCIVLYNPVDDNSIIRKSLKKPEVILKHDAVAFVSVGRIEFQKGYDRLIQIVVNLKQKGYNFHIYILGEGSQKQELQQKCIELKINDNVHFIGYYNNPYSIMKQADAFICSSRTEGFSTAVTEALVLGLPVVTTNCAGMDELLENGQFGIICENTDLALEEAMMTILNNPASLKTWKEKALIRGKEFCLEKSMKSIEELLNG